MTAGKGKVTLYLLNGKNRHTCGNGTVKLNAEVELREELYQPARKASTLPVDRRRYIRTDLPTEEVKALFLNTSFTDSPEL